MSEQIKTLLLAASLAFATPALAQDTAKPTETAEAPDAGLSLGEEATDGPKVGDTYVKEESGDWSLRCIVSGQEEDPCQLYQLLRDENGNSVAEISLFRLPEGGQAIAGATIITPLETLLTEQLTLSVDSAQGRRYPYTFCTQVGCYSRIGLTASDVAAFKRGAKATVRIVPAGNPQAEVKLNVSLKGFTAGFDKASVAQ